MGYVSAMSPCVKCGRLFTYNPLRVPSVVVNGTREPLCRECVEAANTARAAKGLATWTIYPDSYEPVEEHEIPWPEER